MELNTPYRYGQLTRTILNEEPKKGNSKTKQMKQIESLYKVEQKGRKYILVEKYDEPKEIIDNRQESYISLIEIIRKGKLLKKTAIAVFFNKK